MLKFLPALLVVIIAFPSALLAQESGSFVGSLGLGLGAAQGDFADEAVGHAANTGFGIEAELRYYIFGGFAVGGNINYLRFASSFESDEGRVSYNFRQAGGLAKMNLFDVADGKLYLAAGAGVFTPSVHYYVPANSFGRSGNESGTYFFGGFGLISQTNRKAMYELEFKYNIAKADHTIESISPSDVWNFIYIGIKISFSTKGLDSPPRY